MLHSYRPSDSVECAKTWKEQTEAQSISAQASHRATSVCTTGSDIAPPVSLMTEVPPTVVVTGIVSTKCLALWFAPVTRCSLRTATCGHGIASTPRYTSQPSGPHSQPAYAG